MKQLDCNLSDVTDFYGTYVLLIWITEWIILYVTVQKKKEYLEVVKIDNFTERQLISFDQQTARLHTRRNTCKFLE